MSIDAAINKAWDELGKSGKDKTLKVRFIGSDYLVELEKKRVTKLGDSAVAKDYYALLILHYILNQDSAGEPAGDWISFRDLEGGNFYYSVFRQRAIDKIVKKFANNADGLFIDIQKIGGEKLNMADAAVQIKAFEKVPVAVLLWKQDEELPGDANILFKENIKKIFCTEDVAVLGEIIASKL